MKHSSMVVVVLLAAAAFIPALQALPQDQHEHAAAPVSAVVPTQRYAPDAPLRAGMRTAHQAVAELQHAESGHMSAAMTRDRAATVEQAVVFMFANCKLSAEPDTALHGILVRLLTAAQALQAAPDNTRLVADMRAAIAHYPQYFNDPGWDQPAAPVDE
jgi:hypothetical protein